MSWYVYILKCNDNSLYTGSTNNIEKRCVKHNKGKGAKYTAARLPVILLWFTEEANKSDALKLEFKIKKLSREDKLKLISGDIDKVALTTKS